MPHSWSVSESELKAEVHKRHRGTSVYGGSKREEPQDARQASWSRWRLSSEQRPMFLFFTRGP